MNSLNNILKSVMSEMHTTVLTMPYVTRQHFFTVASTTNDIISSPARIHKNNRMKLRKTVGRVFQDLHDSDVLLKHYKKDLGSINIPKDKSVFVYEFNNPINLNFLTGMLALSFVSRTGISTYDWLSRMEDSRQNSHDLSDWALFLKNLYHQFETEEESSYSTLPEHSNIPESTIRRRIEGMAERGDLYKKKIDEGRVFVIGENFNQHLQENNQYGERKLSEIVNNSKLPDKFNINELCNIMGEGKRYNVERMISRMESSKAVNQVEGVKNDARIIPSEKFTKVMEEFFVPLMESYENGDSINILRHGLNHFLEEGKFKMLPYWDAITKSLETYKEANPNLR
ncbi:MAG: hypothetical protein ACQER9_04390 [Nanobdellota archaeon]